MNDFANHLAEDRRLVILRVLLESAGYTANEYLLHSMVERLGHMVSTDRIRTDLTWLKEQDLLAVDDVAGVLIAKLVARGEDVARGRAVVPGVKRPRAE
jgi:hypothetical protein